MIIIEIVVASAICINRFPPTYGISTTIILKTTVTGLHINDKKIHIYFLLCIQSHEEHDNGMGI